jgi:putative DNA primase/helicase
MTVAKPDVSFEFRAVMADAGLDPGPELLLADGNIHRYRSTSDKPGRKNCWYCLFDSGAGVFGSWRLGIEYTWAASGGNLTPSDRQCIAESQQKAEAERRRRRDIAAVDARRMWGRGRPIVASNEHPYLVNKKIQPHGARLFLHLLLVPVLDTASDELVSLQMISADGSKRFLAGGRVAGGSYLLVGETPSEVSEIHVAEGFATAATICETTGVLTAVAFNAGNLPAVSEALREKYPQAKITVCADNDRGTVGNPGVTKATDAARSAHASLAIPSFAGHVEGTDFNDLCLNQGVDAVRDQIAGATPPAASGVPTNFKLTKDMVYVLREHKNKDGQIETAEHPVCSRLEVVALTRDIHGSEWGRLLHFKDPDGGEHEWAMPTEMLGGDGTEYRARLLEQGLTIWPTREARYGLHEYLARCRPDARARAVTRVGWHGNGMFVLPDQAFGQESKEQTLYQNAAAVSHAFNISGYLEDWQREVASRCAGNSRLIFAISAAFGAPLLRLTGDESGGFHYVGRSSLGKTMALRAGGSVWGGSQTQAGYLRQWRATANGLEGVAALHCDVVLCLDELSEVSAREAGQAAYMLANSAGKARAYRDGSARRPYTWRLLFLSSGEITLADKIREDGRQKATAGQQVRILDIPADCRNGFGLFQNIHGAKNGQQFAHQLNAATQSYYGTAARAFLTEIAKQQAERIAQTVRNHQNDFITEYCPPGADGQVRRAATRFGLVAASGELATALQITGWEVGDATWAAGVCFQAWLAQRGHAGPTEIEDGIEQVRSFFALHGESRFSSESHSANGRPTINRTGFRKDGYFWVFPAIFRLEIAAGFEWHSLAAALLERGMLIAGTDGKIQRPVRNPEGGKLIRMLCFTSTVLADEEPSIREFAREASCDED